MLEKRLLHPHILDKVAKDATQIRGADYNRPIRNLRTLIYEDAVKMPDTCPIWDLTDLYSGITDVKLASDVASCTALPASTCACAPVVWLPASKRGMIAVRPTNWSW